MFDDTYISLQDAAALLGVSPMTVWRMVQQRGEIPGKRFGERCLRISVYELRKYIENARVKGE